jgi:hypothetical protein
MGKKLASSRTAWEIKKPRPRPTKPAASSPKDRAKSRTSSEGPSPTSDTPRGMSAIAAPLTPNKRMSSAYDAATPLPRKSGKAKKGYSINNVMCSHTRKK